MTDLINEISHKIEEFLQLQPGDIKKGNRLGKEICEGSEELEELVLEEKSRERYMKILSGLKTYSSKLSKDVTNSKKGLLRGDWKQFAEQDLSRFKDEVLAFQEFLASHKTTLRKRLIEGKYGLDFRDLARRLMRESSVDEVTRSQFSKLVERMDDGEIRAKVEEFKDRLNRISNWLLALDEMKTEVKNAER